MRIICKLVKWAIIIALVVGVISVLISGVLGVFVAFGICSAISGGLEMAGNAYQPGDIYVRHMDDWRR